MDKLENRKIRARLSAQMGVSMEYDITILGGSLIDPETSSRTIGNIGIKDGKIAIITRDTLVGKEEINAVSCIVCPGIIDPHAHVEGNLGPARNLAAMGVTTVYNGNCGMSPDHMEDFLHKYEREGFLINQMEQIGHTSLREQVGAKDRYQAATLDQIDKMKELLQEAFTYGVNGLSFGLEYVPGSSDEEVLELAKIAARYGRLISIHTRSDCYEGLGSLREAINITKKTGAAVHISHLVYQYGMGMATEALHMIEDAMEEGYDISVDSGMYSSFATAIGSAVFDEGCTDKWDVGYDSIVAGTGIYRGKPLTKEMYEDLRKNYPEEVGIGMVGKEYEVFEILKKPYMMVSTDAGTIYDNGIPGHPQDAGTYPRFFHKMVLEQNAMTYLEAIKRCTYLPAKRLGLKNKGRLKSGADADILIFNPDRIKDHADYPCYGETDARPEGIRYVIVNGEVIVRGIEVLEKKPGKILKNQNMDWNWH